MLLNLTRIMERVSSQPIPHPFSLDTICHKIDGQDAAGPALVWG